MDRDQRRSGERNFEARASGDPKVVDATRARPTPGLSGLAFAGLGFQFAASIVVFYYVGQWVDRRLGTTPVFVLTAVLVGSGASFFAMYRQLTRAQKRQQAARTLSRGADGSAGEGP